MPEKVKGLLESGNVGDLEDRPRVKNPDGSVSTIRSMSFNDGKREVLIPTANDGLVYSDDDAIDRYNATGEHLGKFDTPDNATAYAIKLHKDQEAQTADGANLRKDQPVTADRRAAVDTVGRAARPVAAQPQTASRVDNLAVRNLAKKYLEWVTKKRESPLPQVIQPAARRAQEALSWRPEPLNAEQDRQIAENKRALEIAEAHAHPAQDGGEIDAPRPPIQMQREFSNDQEKEAYLERIRQAQKNAGSK